MILLVFFVIQQALFRELWFDEALTVLNFMMLPGPGAVYHNYAIPNNHILYTILLQWWDMVNPNLIAYDVYLRLLSVVAAVLTIGAMCCFFPRRAGGIWIAAMAIVSFVCSAPFAIYATAVRGYMWSALLVLLALICAWRLTEKRQISPAAILGYCLTSFLAIGMIPVNLAAIGGVVAMVAPRCGSHCYRSGRFWALAVLPLLCAGLFYYPILPQVQNAAALREGWKHAGRAIVYLLLTVGGGMVPLWIAAIAGLVRSWRRKNLQTLLWRSLLWLIPIGMILVLPVAPYPRTFFVWLPLWVFAGMLGVRHWIAWRRMKKKPVRWSTVSLPVVLTVAAIVFSVWLPRWTAPAAVAVANGELDDFSRPYYMENSYAVSPAIAALKPMKTPAIFLSFQADPWPLMFYGALAGIERELWYFDGPRGAVESLPDEAILVLHRGEDPSLFARRFGFAELSPVKMTSFHAIYRGHKK